jgi:glycosyltransferase involved in cell wall biosynthesis
MRIAVWHNLPHGGARRALYDHLKALKELGNYIEIWTTNLHPGESLSLKEFGEEHVISFATETRHLIDNYKNLLSIVKTKKAIQVLKQLQKKSADEINAKGFDIAFINSCSISYMPFISEFLKIPSILYLGEPYRWLYEASPENVWQAPEFKSYQVKKIIKDYIVTYSKRIQVRQEISAAKAYTKILVNSFYSKESVLKAYGIEPDVCKLGVSTEMFNNRGVTEKEHYAVGMGVIYHPKGADRAIYLLSRINISIRPILLWIANGAEPVYLKKMEEYAKEKEVDFRLLLNITDAELVNCVSKASFMIYTPRLEPLGLAPLEANACGTYVIGIAEGGVRETISHKQNGFLIDGVDDEKFVEYAELLLRDKDMSMKLGLEARSFVKLHWDFNNLKNNLSKAFDSVST